jgi:hypothetical protein
MSQLEDLYQLLRNQITDEGDIESGCRQFDLLVNKVCVDETIVNDLKNRFRDEISPATALKLLVNWGTEPKLGHRSTPEFNLLCKGFGCRPHVTVAIDSLLDHKIDDSLRELREIEQGLWSFFSPFTLTSEGNPCQPGTYIIEINIYFSQAPSGFSNFYRTVLKLYIPSDTETAGGVLEIKGDGQSMVNLHGYDLKQFSKIVLNGGSDGVINLQNSNAKVDSAKLQQEECVFEYMLKPDFDKQKKMPVFNIKAKSRNRLTRACLEQPNGQKTLIVSENLVTFGRNRENNIILRFLPSSTDYDQFSRYLSRTHIDIKMTSDGVAIEDRSSSGVIFDNKPVDKMIVLKPKVKGQSFYKLRLGKPELVSKSFDMEMHLFASDLSGSWADRYFWYDLYAKRAMTHNEQIHRDAIESGVDAIRLDRTNNLIGMENYVLLYRQATIGDSNSSCIWVDSGLGYNVAKLLHLDRQFWIEKIAIDALLVVDGITLKCHEVQPLKVGSEIQIGEQRLLFTEWSQLYLG